MTGAAIKLECLIVIGFGSNASFLSDHVAVNVRRRICNCTSPPAHVGGYEWQLETPAAACISGIQTVANCQRELLRIVWFLKIMQSVLQSEIVPDHIGAVAAREDDFEPWLVRPQFFR